MASKLTVCKACGKEVAKSAKVCPHCGKKLQMGWFLKTIIIIFLLAIIIPVYQYVLGPSDQERAAERMRMIEAIAASPADGLRPDGELNHIFGIMSDYTDIQRENKEKEIKGKIIEWVLPVYEVKKGKNDDYYHIQTSNGKGKAGTFLYVYPRDAKEAQYIENLKTDDSIRIKGKIAGVTMRNIKIDPAVLPKQDVSSRQERMDEPKNEEKPVLKESPRSDLPSSSEKAAQDRTSSAPAIERDSQEREKKSKEKESSSPPSSVKQASSSLPQNVPQSQARFVEAVTMFIDKYGLADNELKKSSLRTERKIAIQHALAERYDIENWIGTLTDMGTTSNRNAYISIQPDGCGFRVQTWNNELSDINDNTLIPHGSELYKKAAELTKGTNVAFSGRFVPGVDFVEEQSMTEDGAMTDPEFTVILTGIEGLRAVVSQADAGKLEEGKSKAVSSKDIITPPRSEQKTEDKESKSVKTKEPTAAASIDRPVQSLGDTYIVESIFFDNPKLNHVTERRVVSVSSDTVTMTSQNIASKAKTIRTLEFTPEWNLVRTRNPDGGGVDFSPPLKYYDFPLYPGKTWKQTSVEKNVKSGATREFTLSVVVGDWEDVSTPAGTFKGIKISIKSELRDHATGKVSFGTDDSWYVPEVRRSVKSETASRNSEGIEERQLIQLREYKLAKTEPEQSREMIQSFMKDQGASTATKDARLKAGSNDTAPDKKLSNEQAQAIFIQATNRMPVFCEFVKLQGKIHILGVFYKKNESSGKDVVIATLSQLAGNWQAVSQFVPEIDADDQELPGDFELTTIEGNTYLYFSRKRIYYGKLYQGYDNAEFLLYSLSDKQLFKLEYLRGGDSTYGEFDNISAFEKQPELLKYLEDKISKSQLIYKIKPEERDIEHPNNYAKKWVLKNPDIYKANPGVENEIIFCYYQEDLFSMPGGSLLDRIESPLFRVETFFAGPVLGYDKAAKRYFVIWIPEGMGVGGSWGGRSFSAAFNTDSILIIRSLSETIEIDLAASRFFLVPEDKHKDYSATSGGDLTGPSESSESKPEMRTSEKHSSNTEIERGVKDTPKCSNSDVQQAVIDISLTEVRNQFLTEAIPNTLLIHPRRLGYPTYADWDKARDNDPKIKMVMELVDKAVGALKLSLTAIRTKGVDPTIRKCWCAADLQFGDDKSLPITYTAQYTDDGEQVYVSVYGLE